MNDQFTTDKWLSILWRDEMQEYDFSLSLDLAVGMSDEEVKTHINNVFNKRETTAFADISSRFAGDFKLITGEKNTVIEVYNKVLGRGGWISIVQPCNEFTAYGIQRTIIIMECSVTPSRATQFYRELYYFLSDNAPDKLHDVFGI